MLCNTWLVSRRQALELIHIKTEFIDKPATQAFNCFASFISSPNNLYNQSELVTPCPDTPAIGPDTPGVEFLFPLIWSSGSHKYNKHSISLSQQLTFTPSPFPLFLSLPHLALPLPQALTSKSPIPTRPQSHRSFQPAWGTFLSMCSSLGRLRFQVLRASKA